MPKLVPLPPGYAFDSAPTTPCSSGKAYNFQYAWNPGGVFTPRRARRLDRAPDASPGLENYDGRATR